MNSRSKGKRGELEASKEWSRIMGGAARRGQQFSGGGESPDVVSSHENLHLEVKRCEAGNPYVWMDQAVRDCGGRVPVVLHRRNGRDWLMIVRLADALRLAKEIGSETAAVDGSQVSAPVSCQGVPAAGNTDERDAGLLAVRRRGRAGDHRPAEYPG